MTPWTTAYQAPPSMGFSRQEYWSGVPLPSPDPYVTFIRGTVSLYMCKEQRKVIILIYELIETHISVGMLERSEKEKATQSSILAWEMPWAEEPGGL